MKRRVRFDFRSGDPWRAYWPIIGMMVVLGMIGAAKAQASGTFYVDGANASCSDAGPGSSAAPYCTISAAVAGRPA